MFSALANLDTRGPSEEGVWFSLRHPGTYEPLPLRLKLAGPDSKLRLECIEETARRVGRAVQIAPNNRLDPLERRRIEAECLAPTVLAWEGFEEEFARANVERMFVEYRWVYDQVDNFSATRANFLPKTEPGGSEPSPTDSDANSS